MIDTGNNWVELEKRAVNFFNQQKKGKKINRKFVKNQIALARKNGNVPFAVMHLVLLIPCTRSVESNHDILKLLSAKVAMCAPDENMDDISCEHEKWYFHGFIVYLLSVLNQEKSVRNDVVKSMLVSQLYVLDTFRQYHTKRDCLDWLLFLNEQGLAYRAKEKLRLFWGETLPNLAS